MEAVPRLPMISFELKTSTEKVAFGPRIKQYIASFYHEDPETYNEEIHSLEALRGVATRPVLDVSACQMLKKYYCQLHFLKSRFPMEEGQPCATSFSWKDAHSSMICAVSDIDFEISCILYNIGALHSQLGALDSRTNSEGMKMACTHFQCAVWAFQTLRENYSRMVACLLPPEMMNFMKQICLAHAQECILEKSMLDNRKATIIAKVAVQVVDYYKKSLKILQTGTEDGSFGDILGTKVFKKWSQYISFKVAYHKCVSYLYQGQQAEEQQKMGERVAFYQIACECLEEARKLSSSLQNKEQIDEALAFTLDVVEGKRKAAKNENEFIYHEDVPDKSSLQEVKGASLVKGIPFNVNDSEVSGADIFARLVPMEAHEASSLYSEHKAQMLRRIGELIESKDQALAEFLSSLQLDALSQVKNATGLTQDIVDRAAAISGQPTAVQDLISSMSKLSDIYHDVEAMLKETQELLKEEEQNEKNYQHLMGKRAPSIIATDLSREYQKYMEAHNKASESNQNLHKAMTTHIANLKLLLLPLEDLQSQIPSIELPNSNIDIVTMEQLEKLMKKIDEMKSQRASLWNELRAAVHNDDITGVLVTKESNQSLDDVFQKELEKHKKLCDLIEQNTAAQENILKAMVNMYAEFSDSRKFIQDVLNKRNTLMTALITSYDTYEDLLSKAQKGLEFYNKLETNVTKLLQRVRSACNVQQEERDQILKKNRMDTKPVTTTTVIRSTTRTPKLKDYLDSRKGKDTISDISQYPSCYPAPETAAWPPAVRPAPLGSEFNVDSTCMQNMDGQSFSNYNIPTYYNQQQSIGTGEADDLAKRMENLMTKDKSSTYIPMQYSQQYNTNQNYNTYVYPSTNSNTSLTNSYQTISSITSHPNYPNYDASNSGYQSGSTGTSIASGSNQATSAVYSQGYNHGTQYQSYNVPQSQMSTGYHSQGVNYNTSQPQIDSGYKSTDTLSAQSQIESGRQIIQSAPTANLYSRQVDYPTSTNQCMMNSYDQHIKQSTLPNNANYQTYYNENTNSIPQEQYQNFPNSTYQSFYYDSTTNYNTYTTAQSGDLTNTSCGQNSSTPQVPSYYSYNTSSNYVNQQPIPTYSSLGCDKETTYQTDSNNYVNNPTNYDNTSYVANQAAYSTNQAAYPTNQAAYPTNQAAYPTNQAAYPTNQAAYSTNQAAYSTNQAVYSTNQPDYSTNQADYSTNQVTYSTNQAAYSTNNQMSYYADQNAPNSYQNTHLNNQTPYPNNQVSYQTPYSSNTEVYGNNKTVYQETVGYQNNQNVYSTSSDVPGAPNYSVNSANVQPAIVETPKKASNVDLLAGLDFSISQAPLTPQVSTLQESKENEPRVVQTVQTTSKLITTKVEEKQHENVDNLKITRPQKDPFQNPVVVKQFGVELEKFEKFVDGICNKTANGQTTLELKWKLLQDSQEMDSQKRIVSVARCYPMKNRYPDILPYDFSRVELKTCRDDYINATHLKDITNMLPPFIITQAPLQNTFDDFWSMVWEQQIENIICIMNDSEFGDDMYWPNEIGKNITFPNKIVSLENVITKEFWTERSILINILETRECRTVNHLQFVAWPRSILPVCPGAFVQFVQHVLILTKQQKNMSVPLLVHCVPGIGRSGLFCLLITLFEEVTRYNGNLPDIQNVIMKMSNFRKNILRDREHLKFAYNAFLYYLKDLYKRHAKEPIVNVEKKVIEETEVDPLSLLDPLWATKKEK